MTKIKKRLGLSVPKTLYEKIVDIATYYGKTINSMCIDIFWDYFEKGVPAKKDGAFQSREQVLGCGRGVVREAEPTRNND